MGENLEIRRRGRWRPASCPAASAVRTASAVGAETATSDRRADHGRLLHHLDRDAAGQQHHAVGGGDAAAPGRRPACRARCGGRHPRAAATRPCARRPERRGMDRARLRGSAPARRQRRAAPAMISAGDERCRPRRPAAAAASPRPGSRCRTGRSRSGRRCAPAPVIAPQRAARRATCAVRCRASLLHHLRAASISSARRRCLRSGRSRRRNPPGPAASPSSPHRCRRYR